MNERQYELLEGKRLFMFNMKLYFPEYLHRRLAAQEYPFPEERLKAHCSMCQYLEKRPLGERLLFLFEVLDERECECLRMGRSPRPLLDEVESILVECERRMGSGEAMIIAFPTSGR